MCPIVVPAASPGAPTSASLQIGRLLIGAPTMWQEQTGDPVGQAGGAVVPAARVPPQHQVTIATIAADSHPDTQAARLSLRRRLRSLLNNTPLKLGAFLYIIYSDDPEQDGWYIPGQGTLQDLAGSIGLATGFWQAQLNPYLAGHQRTHREARQTWLKDLRTGLYARDTLGWVYSTDFSVLPALALTVLPNGASSVSDSVTGGVVSGAPLPAGRDGGACQLVQGLTDLTVLAYERAESAMGLSDVIAYDRRGAGDAPTTGPGATWEEVYGPDYPWNWQTTGQPADAPVLDNGLVRVRYDATAGNPGFRIDAWNGSAYVEQGKVTIYRVGDVAGYCDTFISAGILADENGGWTPERGVVSVVLANSADVYSRERVIITLQRGQQSAKFEVYPAPKASGAAADALITYTPNGPDSNDTLMFEPSTAQPPASGTDSVWSTASSNWTSASGTFSSSTANFLSILRSQGGATTVGAYQVNIAVVQQAVTFLGITDTSGYGGAGQNAVYVRGAGGMGYLQARVGFVATQADQVQGTTSSWSSSQASRYRVFGLSGSTWTDYGEYSGSAVSTGSSTRVEAFQTQDRTRTGALYGGCRDRGQAALYDSRQLGALVAR